MIDVDMPRTAPVARGEGRVLLRENNVPGYGPNDYLSLGGHLICCAVPKLWCGF